MISPRVAGRLAVAAAAAVTLSLVAAGAATGHAASTTTAGHSATTKAHPSKASLLHPKHKYFGVFAPPAPSEMGPLDSIKSETGKMPNLVVWYQDWGSGAAKGTANIYTAGAKQACAAGVLPMLTWESWDTSVTKSGEGAAYAQPAFSATKIIDGKYDAYIRNSAKEIKALHCPIAVRFDQEQNGYWYPWGLSTTGMGSGKDTGPRFVAMWRHVWQIFHSVHANNVLWVWSPNFQGPKHKGLPSLAKSYPGNKYVDWVGIDGYYVNNPKQTFAKLFGPTIKQLKFASSKPWIVSETAVGTGPTKPQQITNLLDNIASHKQFNGFVYFDATASRSDWRFQETSASLKAFKAGISKSVFGSAKPGTL